MSRLLFVLGVFFGFANVAFASDKRDFQELVSHSCDANYSLQRISRNSFFSPPIPHISAQYNSDYQFPDAGKVVENKVISSVKGITVDIADNRISLKSQSDLADPVAGFIHVRQLVQIGSKICKRGFLIFVSVSTEPFMHDVEWVSGGSGAGVGALSLPYGSTTIRNDSGGEHFLLTDCALNLVVDVNDGRLKYFMKSPLGRGNRLGQLNTPADIKVSPYDGNVYIVDDRNHRVQVFDRKGEFQDMFGAAGKAGGDARTDLGYFRNPLSIEFVGNQTVVTDYGHNRLQFLDPKTSMWRAVGAGNGDGSVGRGPAEFNGPYYLTRNEEDHLIVVDRGNHRIQILDQNGKFLSQFGTDGSGKASKKRGYLDSPHELDIDLDGRILVTDTFNDRINIYDSRGSFINDLKVPGFQLPKVIATSKLDVRFIYLAFVGSQRVTMKLKLDPSIFKPQGLDKSEVAQTNDGEHLAEEEKPVVVSLLAKNAKGKSEYKKYCATCHSENLDKIPQLGDQTEWAKRAHVGTDQLMKSVLKGKGLMPVRAGCDECSDSELKAALNYIIANSISELAQQKVESAEVNQSVAVKQEWMSLSTRNIQGLDVTKDSDGVEKILAAEGYAASGKLLTSDFEVEDQFSTGSPDRDANALTGDVLFLHDGRYAFSVYRGGRIDVFNKDGSIDEQIGSLGTDEDQLQYPLGLTQLPNGNILVADSGNQRVQEYSLDGKWVRSIGHGRLELPYDLKFAQGKIVVSDRAAHKIVVFDEDGHHLNSIDEIEFVDGTKDAIESPQGIDFDSVGNLYIVDSGKKRIVVATMEGDGKAVVSDKSFGWVRQIELMNDDSFIVSVLTEPSAEGLSDNPGGILHFQKLGRVYDQDQPEQDKKIKTQQAFSVIQFEKLNSFSSSLDGKLPPRQQSARVVEKGNLLSVSGKGQLYAKELFAYDPTKDYKFSLKTRLLEHAGTPQSARMYAGFATFDQERNLEQSLPGTHRYGVMNNVISSSADWQSFSGIFSGEGDGSANLFRKTTKYFRPVILFNFTDGASTTIEVTDMVLEIIPKGNNL